MSLSLKHVRHVLAATLMVAGAAHALEVNGGLAGLLSKITLPGVVAGIVGVSWIALLVKMCTALNERLSRRSADYPPEVLSALLIRRER